MRNLELECVPGWRFCNIPYGEKGPRARGWQTNPLPLSNINNNGNVGVLLGPYSGGLCAIDFDGTSAWQWFSDTFQDLPIPTTITWASGRTDRCQMAFMVPQQYWDILKTIKIQLSPIPDTTKFEGFEFRWTGGQSVLPPSLHPDTQQNYFWINSPSTTDIATLPEEILCYWLLKSNPIETTTQPPADYNPPANDEVVAIYQELKNCYPSLGYERWSKATWAVCRELGQADGLAVMKYFWPPQQDGEYERLFTSKYAGQVVTLGSVVTWIREKNPEFKTAKTYTGMAAVQQVRKDNYKLKNLIRNS